MRRALSLTLAGFIAVVSLGAACEQPKTKIKTITLYPVGENAELDLEVLYPDLEDENGTCGPLAARRSYLLSIDTGGPGWDIRLLFDGSAETLYGCGGPAVACTSAALGFTLLEPQRVMLEALDVTPSQYATATAGVGVLCRGIADAAVLASDIVSTVTPGETPPDPAPSPTTIVTTHAVTLRMLKVGGTNPLPYELGATAPPSARYGAAASFSDDTYDIGPASAGGNAGKIAFAGGALGAGTVGATLSNAVHLFDPVTLSFTAGPPLSSARAGLTATAFKEAGGASSILFAGGADQPTAQTASDDADILSSTGAMTATTMFSARAFHGAVYMGTAMNLVLLAGGEPWKADDAAPFAGGASASGTFEIFVPAGASPSPVPTPCNALAAGGFCQPNTNTMAQRATCRAELLPRDPALPGPHLVFIGGQSNGSDLNTNSVFQMEGNSGGGGFAGGGNLANNSTFPATARLGKTGITELDGRPVSFGGFTALATLSANADANYFPAEAGDAFVRDMSQPRGLATATTLRDSTVLVIGGMDDSNPSGLRSIERFIPFAAATLDSSARFEFIVPSGSSNCDPATGPAGNCARLSTARFGHTATRLAQTQTWLDGSVLVIGGAPTGERAAELFVPPMTCDPVSHLAPVSPGTFVDAEPLSNATLPPLCDRDRAGEPVTDPRTGSFQ